MYKYTLESNGVVPILAIKMPMSVSRKLEKVCEEKKEIQSPNSSISENNYCTSGIDIGEELSSDRGNIRIMGTKEMKDIGS